MGVGRYHVQVTDTFECDPGCGSAVLVRRVEQPDGDGRRFDGTWNTRGESAVSHRLAERRHIPGATGRIQQRRATLAAGRQPELRRGFLLHQVLDLGRRRMTRW